MIKLKIWLKFKLLTCGLKSHNTSVLLECFKSYLILYFFFIIFFWEERDIKVEQNFIFNFAFNESRLQNFN